jgi:hypothetical protein
MGVEFQFPNAKMLINYENIESALALLTAPSRGYVLAMYKAEVRLGWDKAMSTF